MSSPWKQGQMAMCQVCGHPIKYQGTTWEHQTGKSRHIGWPISEDKKEMVVVAPGSSPVAWW